MKEGRSRIYYRGKNNLLYVTKKEGAKTKLGKSNPLYTTKNGKSDPPE